MLRQYREEGARQISAAILEKRSATGWYQTWRYRTGETDDGTLLIVMEATNTRASMRSVLWITLIVGLSALLAVFTLLVPLSKWAIRPIAETYEKQRQFITDASHELKTPLTVISANTEILAMTNGEDEWTQGIARQTEKMQSLIGRMVQMSRLDEGEHTLTFEGFDLSEAVYDTAMSFAGVAAAKGLKLAVNTAPGLKLNGDEAAIRQATAILVDNAVKYCDEGGEIQVSLSKSGKSMGKCCLCVINTFAAVPSLELEKLFHRFYRADKAHTANNSYGLGLPIAQSIAELHHGRLTAQNVDGNAVAFSLELPRVK